MRLMLLFLLCLLHESFAQSQSKDKKNEENAYFLEIPFFRLPSMKIPVIKEGNLVAYIYIQFDMKAVGKESFDEAKILIPRLTDAVFRDLYGVLQDRWFISNRLVAATFVDRVLFVANKILGDSKVEAAFIKELVVSKI